MYCYVEILSEVPHKMIEDDWNLCFQKVVYHYEKDEPQNGYRFIWRRPDGSLQAARGQARIESLEQMEDLIAQAKAAGFFD